MSLEIRTPIIPVEEWEKCQDENKFDEVITRPSYTFFQESWRCFKKNKLALASLMIIFIIGILALIGPFISPHTYDGQSLDYANISYRLPIHRVNGQYFHVASGLRVIEVTSKGVLIKPLEFIENDMVNKRKVYGLNDHKIVLDFKEELKIIVDGKVSEVHQTVHNKTYLLGSDKLGRDLLVRLLYGARISIFVALIATFLNCIIGVLYGGIAAYFGGWVDNLMFRIVDIVSAVPMMLYIILLMVVIGPGLKTIIISMGVVFWIGTARLVRGEILSLKSQEFVMAAQVIGVSDMKIIIRHLLPNAIGPIMVSLTFMIPDAIFTEAFLSFIGLGIPAPAASLGTLCESALEGLQTFPYQLFFPAIAISITILSFNLLGDGLRDAFDPRMRK